MMAKTYLANSTTYLRGFTLVELVVVIVMLAILSVYGIANNLDSAEMTIPSQAERLASDLRLAQTLAFTTGNAVTVTVAGVGTTYTIAPCTSPCTTSSVPLKKDIRLNGSPSVTFSTNGQPTPASISTAQFCLVQGTSATCRKTVGVSAQGHVTVTPP